MKELAIIYEQLAIVASETLGGALAPGGRRPRRPQASSPANGKPPCRLSKTPPKILAAKNAKNAKKKIARLSL